MSKNTLEDALMGGPGLDAYAFCADLYCIACGKQIMADLWEKSLKASRNDLGEKIQEPGWDDSEFEDSEILPQPVFFGESDGEQYCANCEDYLYGGDPDEGDPDEGDPDDHVPL